MKGGTWEAALRQAVDRQELRVYYQAIVSVPTGQISGFEALVRWLHPDHGLLSLVDFLPLAEQTGLIFPITQWTLEEACRQIRTWRSGFSPASHLGVSVNVNAMYLAKHNLVEEISAVLSDNSLAPQDLALEMSESQIMGNEQSLSKVFTDLSDLGTQLHIDNYGTGYSSLRQLANFPVRALKIDRSLVLNMYGDDVNAAIVRAIAALAHNLGFDLIAVGVEKAEVLDFLRTVNCQYVQGYFFSLPVDHESAIHLLAQGLPAHDRKKVAPSRLRTFALFAELKDEELAEIAQNCLEATVEPGTIVIRQGKVGHEVYLMEEGSVSVYREQGDTSQFLSVLEAPTIFGEMAIVNPERIRTATVKALGHLRLLTIPVAPFVSFLRRFPTVKARLSGLVGERSASQLSKHSARDFLGNKT